MHPFCKQLRSWSAARLPSLLTRGPFICVVVLFRAVRSEGQPALAAWLYPTVANIPMSRAATDGHLRIVADRLYPDDMAAANLTFRMFKYVNNLSDYRTWELRRALKVSETEALRCLRTMYYCVEKTGDAPNDTLATHLFAFDLCL